MFSPRASSSTWTQTLDLERMRQVLYHYATTSDHYTVGNNLPPHTFQGLYVETSFKGAEQNCQLRMDPNADGTAG